MIKKLHVDVPFLDVLLQVPKYAKFLKELLSKKRSWEDIGKVASIGGHQETMPKKLDDPGEFYIPSDFGSLTFNCLCDLGSSVNIIPLSICKKLSLGEPTH